MQAPIETQIIENLHPAYRSICREIKRQKVYSGEQVFYAADFTGNRGTSVLDLGFMIFTDERYLEVFERFDKAAGISYYKSGSNWDKMMGQRVDDRRWIPLSRTSKESDQRRSKLPNCEDFAYSNIKGIIRNDYSILYENERIPLVELRFDLYGRYGEFYKVFKAKDGAAIYDLVNLAAKNSGKLPVQTIENDSESGDTEVLRLIKALGDLRKAGLLTDGEFEQKKRELLGRL